MDAAGNAPADVVLPPREIRNVLEKTAGYVVRNGATFEERIRQKEKSNPKFSFLTENDAYHDYYEWRLSEIRAGRGTAVSAGREPGDSSVPLTEIPTGPSPPPEFHFSARMPNISAQDLDVVKLAAVFVAKNGRAFLTSLSHREGGNFQFDFLRPQHSLYQYFSRLVDQYTELLGAHGADEDKSIKVRKAGLSKNAEDKLHILDRAKRRAEWVQFQEQQKQKREEEVEAEKTAYAQIDWHDFVVVEVVTFDEGDEELDLPAPTSLSDLQSASLEQKAIMSLQPNHMRIEEAMPTDEPLFQHGPPPPHHTPQTPAVASVTLPPLLPPQPSLVPTHPSVPPSPASTDPATRIPINAPMKIRSDYVPRAQAQRKNAMTAICPNCKQTMPADELSEHMRIELLDPRWREQREKAESRYSTTNLSTADVTSNLKRLASQRSDVFDSITGETVTQEEMARRKRAATSYDGVITGINDGTVGPGQAGAGRAALQAQARERAASGRSIEEQLKHIQEKAARTG